MCWRINSTLLSRSRNERSIGGSKESNLGGIGSNVATSLPLHAHFALCRMLNGHSSSVSDTAANDLHVTQEIDIVKKAR